MPITLFVQAIEQAVTNIDREISENAEHKVKNTSTLCISNFDIL